MTPKKFNIDLNPHDLATVLVILQKQVPNLEVWAFGSRVTWSAKSYSDLDLAIITKEPLTLSELAELKDAFDDSDLLVKVDVVDWANTSDNFKAIIQAQKVVLQTSTSQSIARRGNKKLVTTKLVDLCELIVDCPHSTPEWTDSGFIVLRNQNIRNGSLDLSSPSFTDENGYNSRIKRAVPQAGDIVLTREAPMGEVCIIPEGLQCCLGQRQVLLRPKKDISGEYLFWALQSPFVRHQISWSEGTGTTVSNIRIPVLKAFEIPRWFERESKIASHLSAIKNKSTLSRQINQTLEQMAQALFKSWFVDFDPVVDNALDTGFFEQDLDLPNELLRRAEARKAVRAQAGFKPFPAATRQLFPATFEPCAEPSLGFGGWVPKGWELRPISSLIDLIGGGTPKTSEESYWGGDIPWFSVVDAPNDSDVFVIDTEKKVTALGIEKSSTRMLRKGTTIISARGTVGKCAVVARPMAMNQSCYGIVGIDGIHDYFIYYLIRQSVSHLQQRSHGSVFSTVTRDTFKTFNIAFSGECIANEFGKQISPWFDKILSNNLQKRALDSLRDTLLPKLISGELSLDDVELTTQ
ncbi:restriction endonuclease subunit S [Aeromonas hydrophila]|uniref:restriction endonuclease subunit S n=1 Tax=Aeromonas hydrophila TaxID=644 RepID=UPI0038CF8464